MDFVLGVVFLVSLLFLAIIFGDRLQLFGLTDGRWLTAPLDLCAFFWDMVCEAADRVWCFVFDHFWWVAATVSGGIGVLLIALIMVTGLTDKAEAERLDASAMLQVGSVLDHTTILETDRVLKINATVDSLKDPDHLVYQVPSANRFAIPASIRRRVITDFSDPVTEEPPVVDFPPLETESPAYRPEPDYSRTRLTLTLQPFIERVGRRVRSDKTNGLIRKTLYSLQQDDWHTFSNALAQQRQAADLSSALPQDSQFAVDELSSRVRVIPGHSIAANDLDVEKFVPTDVSSGVFDIQIRVTNRSPDRMDGLLVREMLPASWEVQRMQPVGVYRSSTATWLVTGLQPGEESVLTLSVFPREAGNFLSYTEVSATAAVTAIARVLSDRPADLPDRPFDDRDFSLPPDDRDSSLPRRERTLPPPDFSLPPDISTPPDISLSPDFPLLPDFSMPRTERSLSPPERSPLPERSSPVDRSPPPAERSLPPVERLPDVRLTLLEPPRTVDVGKWVDVLFQIRNVGDAPATGVSLRVQLPLGLDHHDLSDDNIKRVVDAKIRSLEPDERRQVRLTVRPTGPGVHFVTAELLLQAAQLDVRTFEVTAREAARTNDPPLTPRPDFR